MSPRKTRRGVKDESVEVSLQDLDVSKIPDTPETTRRTLRTRRQLKQKNSSDSDVEQSPKLNESKRPTRRGKSKKVLDVMDDSVVNATITSTRKRTRKDKETTVLAEDTSVINHNDEIQEPVSAAKSKVNRSRKRGTQKKTDITRNDSDNAENLPNDQNIINDVPKYLTNEKGNQVTENASNEDDEVANVSIKAAKRLRKTSIHTRFLQPRNRAINSPNCIVTPECSPLTVNLTPHRATKTPRKSPINIGSPKTHSLSPQRLSKTPRKLPVTADSPVPVDKSSPNETHQKVTTDRTDDKSNLNSPAVRSLSRKASKSPKIVTRTAKSKSPRVTSTKVKKSPNHRKNAQVSVKSPRAHSQKKMNSPTIQNADKTTKSPLLVLDRISPSITISPSPEDLITPVITPNAWKKLVGGVESPRRQKTIVKKRSPVTDSSTPLRAIPTPKLDDTKEVSDKSQIISTNSTPLVQLAAKRISALTSSTPRERIRRSLNLSPGLGTSPATSGAPLSVQTFYGTSLRTSPRINNDDKSLRIEDISNALITDDDSSFDISGIKAVESSRNDATLVGNNDEVISSPERTEKTTNDTYELAEPVTPGLKKQNKTSNDTYELEEPKTPGLRKRRSLIESNSITTEAVAEQIPTKRVCRVRFASPTFNSPHKVASKDSISSRSSTPANKGLRKRTMGHIDVPNTSHLKSVKAGIQPRRRSNSLTNFSAETPTVSGAKKRSLSVVDVSHRSTQKNIQNESVNRLSRPRLSITSDKKAEVKTTSAKKAPNFAQIHQKKFAKMESLVDAKKRVEERHNALRNNIAVTPGTSKTVANPTPRANVVKAAPTETTNGAFNRFGYRVRKEAATKLVNKQPAAKRTTEKKVEKRMALKGVRSNRRFELQMKMRNLNP